MNKHLYLCHLLLLSSPTYFYFDLIFGMFRDTGLKGVDGTQPNKNWVCCAISAHNDQHNSMEFLDRSNNKKCCRKALGLRF